MARLNFGMRQAKLLCRIPTKERLDLIAEGSPIILESARGFSSASGQLADKPREADVLEGFVEEGAAKILILMDVVRCPSKLTPQKIVSIVGNFYDHLGRLIYAEAAGMETNACRAITRGASSRFLWPSRSADGHSGRRVERAADLFDRTAPCFDHKKGEDQGRLLVGKEKQRREDGVDGRLWADLSFC